MRDEGCGSVGELGDGVASFGEVFADRGSAEF